MSIGIVISIVFAYQELRT